jgi:hypothetical protein
MRGGLGREFVRKSAESDLQRVGESSLSLFNIYSQLAGSLQILSYESRRTEILTVASSMPRKKTGTGSAPEQEIRMGTYYQGLTQDERQLLNNIFEELRLDNQSVPANELQEKAYYEVITRSVEAFTRGLEPGEGKSILPITLH